MVEVDLHRTGLLNHEQTESFDMLHIHDAPLGGVFHPLQGDRQVVPSLLDNKLLVKTVGKLLSMLLVMDVMDTAIEHQTSGLRVINAPVQGLIPPPISGKIKKGHPGIFCRG